LLAPTTCTRRHFWRMSLPASLGRKPSSTQTRPSFLPSCFTALLAGPIHSRDVAHPAVLRLALQKGISTYDASYVHLADALGIPLATFDERLRAAAGR